MRSPRELGEKDDSRLETRRQHLTYLKVNCMCPKESLVHHEENLQRKHRNSTASGQQEVTYVKCGTLGWTVRKGFQMKTLDS